MHISIRPYSPIDGVINICCFTCIHKLGATLKIETTTQHSRDYLKAIASLSKAIAGAIPLILIGEPGSGASALSSALPGIFDAVSALKRKSGYTLGNTAWILIKTAYACGIARFFANVKLDRRPEGEELETLIEKLVLRLEFLIEHSEQEISAEIYYAPLRLQVFRKLAQDIPHELKLFTLQNPIMETRRLFEKCLIEGFVDFRNKFPNEFGLIETSLSGAFAESQSKNNSLSNHYNYLFKSFNLNPIFGQEDSGVTLADLYVRQRALWVKRLPATQDAEDVEGTYHHRGSDFFKGSDRDAHKWRYVLHVGDLHSTIFEWLNKKDVKDPVRVIAGGPGSGKSTFARAIAIEVIDSGEYDVLFVPLQEIEAAGTFPGRIENLFRARTDLGLNRNPDVLDWVSQSQTSGEPPHRPLLIVCDGLDEIAPPGSAEAANVTADFVQSLSTWIGSRNSGGLHVKALVLGRTISAQEAFNKLGIAHDSLIRVAGLLPLNRTDEWEKADEDECTVDEDGIAGIDQRKTYWDNWVEANKLSDRELPAALKSDDAAERALVELTAEPLLLYLLIWTGYLGPQWEQAANNRNVVYEEIFKQIYSRTWGAKASLGGRNRPVGGHPGTDDISLDDFLLLQEALGLASWSSGARTVNVATFDAILKIYLDEDKYEDLSGSISGSLKSVALQGYTQSIGGEAAGYEFVHKSIGEYLVGRALATGLIQGLNELREKQTPLKCEKAAKKFATIMSHGSLKSEIERFFCDELRMRYSNWKRARREIEGRFKPLMNWLLRQGFPIVQPLVPLLDKKFSTADQADQRIWDVAWTGFQSLAKLAYPIRALNSTKEETWTVGPIELEWPNAQSFVSLFSRLSDRSLVAETGRIAPFGYLDIRGQAVTDYSFGSVIFSADTDEDKPGFSPALWLPIWLNACRLDGLLFYGSNLSQANLSYSSLHGVDLTGAVLDRCDLHSSTCSFTNFSEASLFSSNADFAEFDNCNFSGAKFINTSLKFSKFTGNRLVDNYRFTGPTLFSRAELESSQWSNVELKDTIFFSCQFRKSSFSDTDFNGAKLINTDFDEVELSNSEYLSAHVIDTSSHDSDHNRDENFILFSNGDIFIS